MPDSLDYRLFISGEFKAIREHLDDKVELLHTQLDKIEYQTTQTNSRVTHLEYDVENVEKEIATHAKECPAMPEIKDIKANLVEYNWWKNHPKLAISIIAGAVMAILAMNGFEIIDKLVRAKHAISIQLHRNNYPVIPVDTINNRDEKRGICLAGM